MALWSLQTHTDACSLGSMLILSVIQDMAIFFHLSLLTIQYLRNLKLEFEIENIETWAC